MHEECTHVCLGTVTTPVLANGLNNGFLRSSTRESVKFALMWANQDVRVVTVSLVAVSAEFHRSLVPATSVE